MSIAKVTRKGQITIPKEIRESLGITERDYVIVVVDGEKAILSPVRGSRMSDLKGKLPASRPHPGVEKIRQEVGRKLGEQQKRQTQ